MLLDMCIPDMGSRPATGEAKGEVPLLMNQAFFEPAFTSRGSARRLLIVVPFNCCAVSRVLCQPILETMS